MPPVTRSGRSLRAQLLRWVVPPVLFVILISAGAAYTLALRFATEAYDTALFDAARSLAQQLTFHPDGKVTLTLPRIAREILVSDPYDRIFFRVIADSDQTIAGDEWLPLRAGTRPGVEGVQFYDAEVAGLPVRVGAYVVHDQATGASVTTLFAETLAKRERLSRQLLLTVLVPLVLLTMVVAAFVWRGVERGLAPLNTMASTLARRGWSDLRGVGEHLDAPEEVRPLVNEIDGLMERLGLALSAQSRFISEAAHQLRTPLAGLAAQIDRALISSDIESVKPALDQIRSSARRVTRLVNQLLMLAKAEPGSDPGRQFTNVDLAEIVQQTCMDWVPEAIGRGVDLGYAGDTDPLVIRGDELMLAEMINNLLDNALRYGTQTGGSITVRLTRTPAIEIAVEDDGPGIPEDERARIFERFHRLPGSPAGGSGLGLAIVKEIARIHGARVHVEPREGGSGASFRIRFEDMPGG